MLLSSMVVVPKTSKCFRRVSFRFGFDAKKDKCEMGGQSFLLVSDAIFLIVIFININISNGSHRYGITIHPFAIVRSALSEYVCSIVNTVTSSVSIVRWLQFFPSEPLRCLAIIFSVWLAVVRFRLVDAVAGGCVTMTSPHCQWWCVCALERSVSSASSSLFVNCLARARDCVCVCVGMSVCAK